MININSDKAQLKPVNAKHYSKVFSVKSMATLTKIYRQSSENGLNTVLPTLRKNSIQLFTTAEGTKGSLYCYKDAKEFFTESIPFFRKAIKNSDILETKILSYTNSRVERFNNKMRQVLFPNDIEYNKFEFLTGYENLEFNRTKFWNGMDYIIIDTPTKVDINIPNFIKLPGYRLNLYDSANKWSSEVNILSKKLPIDYKESLASFIELTRLDAIECKQRGNSWGASKKWREYYNIIGSFTTPFDLYYDNRLIRKKSFDYGYAMTIHKS